MMDISTRANQQEETINLYSRMRWWMLPFNQILSKLAARAHLLSRCA